MGEANIRKMADLEEEEVTGKARDVMITETEIATISMSETEARALTTNDKTDLTQQRKVKLVDHCDAGDSSQTHGGRSVLSRTTEHSRTYLGSAIWHKKSEKEKQFGWQYREGAAWGLMSGRIQAAVLTTMALLLTLVGDGRLYGQSSIFTITETPNRERYQQCGQPSRPSDITQD
jgi:hypothetical protein